MSLVSLIVVLIVIGVLMWLVNTQLARFMDGTMLKILNVVVVIVVVLWLVSMVFGPLPYIKVGR